MVRWIDGVHPEVVEPETPVDPRREDLAVDLAGLVKAVAQTEVPNEAVNDPDLQWYRGEPLATMDEVTRQNIERCRALRRRPDRRAFRTAWPASRRWWTPAAPVRR